jgi:hypothetical protein
MISKSVYKFESLFWSFTGVVRYGPFNQKKLYSADFITAKLDKGFAVSELLWYLKVGRQVVSVAP